MLVCSYHILYKIGLQEVNVHHNICKEVFLKVNIFLELYLPVLGYSVTALLRTIASFERFSCSPFLALRGLQASLLFLEGIVILLLIIWLTVHIFMSILSR